MKTLYTFLLSAAVSLVLASPARAVEVTYLPQGVDSLVARFAAIREAKHSIDLSTFIWDPCSSSTKAMVAALAERAKAGVKIRIILDAFNPTHQFGQNSMSEEWREDIAAQLKQANITLRYYMNVGFLPNANQRLHAKVMIVDGKKLIVGGRNFQDDYFGLSDGLNWVDRDILVDDTRVSATAEQRFEILWTARNSSDARVASADTYQKFAGSCLKITARDKQIADWLEANGDRRSAELRPVSCGTVDFYLDDPSFSEDVGGPEPTRRGSVGNGEYLVGGRLDKKETSKALAEELTGAKRNIQLENLCFLPAFHLKTIFDDKKAAGIPVTVYTNSSTDSTILDGVDDEAAKKDAGGKTAIVQLCANTEINDRWELSLAGNKQYWVIHSKQFVVDGVDSVVSSWNIDARSYAENLETAVVVRNCPAFASELAGKFNAYHRLSAPREAKGGVCKSPDGKTPSAWDHFLGNLLMGVL